MSGPVKVLTVDDSALIRAHLKKQISRMDNAQVVGLAPDPYVAREVLLRESPDLVLLDFEMPRIDGLTFLRKIMQFKPTPTLVISSVTPAGSGNAIACLEPGAIDVLCRPNSAYSIDDLQNQIARWLQEARASREGRALSLASRKPQQDQPGSAPPIASLQSARQQVDPKRSRNSSPLYRVRRPASRSSNTWVRLFSSEWLTPKHALRSSWQRMETRSFHAAHF